MTTWMCDNGYHGDSVRRSLTLATWSEMYQGRCAGTVFSMEQHESDCECTCHDERLGERQFWQDAKANLDRP